MDWITLEEASKLYTVSKGSLREWLQKGLIKGVLINVDHGSKRRKWLVNPGSVEEMLQRSDEVTATEAARILGISRSRASQLASQGQVEYRDSGGRRFLKLESVLRRKNGKGDRSV